MKFLQIIFILAIAINPALSQNNFGIELRSSRNITYNAGSLVGYGGTSFVIIKESNTITTNGSVGLFYDIGSRSKVKLHVGRYSIGRKFDITYLTDWYLYDNVKMDINNYLQFTPAFSYNLLDDKIIVPIELGIDLNVNVGSSELSPNYITGLRLSTGVGYRFLNRYIIAGNIVTSRALNSPLSEIINVTYIPYQLGGEVSLSWSFGKN